MQAALIACESDLSGRETKLFGTAAMDQLRESVRSDAEKLFEAHLKSEKFLPFHALFGKHRDMVREEVGEN